MIFGSQKDFELIKSMNRELVNDVIEQEVGYYKISLENSESDIYGESNNKDYYNPVKLNCLIERGDQDIKQDEFGPDLTRKASFSFLRADLELSQVVPEVGDIVLWNNDYYEANKIRENQLFVGKDNNYYIEQYGKDFGASVSITVDCHLTRGEKLGIEQIR